MNFSLTFLVHTGSSSKQMPTNYWILKTEPETYSFEQLLSEKKTQWDGVRNYQARNFIQTFQPKDKVLIYHSGKQRSIVGKAEVASKAYPDPDPKRKGDWVQADINSPRGIHRPVHLSELKEDPKLREILLVKHSRLSVIPVKKQEYERILKLGDQS